jgi:acyl-coenzyme A thioesterase PaaI-like protein
MDDADRPSVADAFAEFRTGTPEEQRSATALTAGLRRFLDSVAAAKMDGQLIPSLIDDLDRWTRRLQPTCAPEDQSLWRKAPRDQPPPLAPALTFVEDGIRLTGTVTFGRFHVGRGGAHGGAIGLVFDEAMGALAASCNRPLARTAFLHVDYRSLTPMDRELTLQAWFDSEQGRKRYLRATISNGERICAEAHGLWVALKVPSGLRKPA